MEESKKVNLLYSYINFLLNENKRLSNDLSELQIYNNALIKQLKEINPNFNACDTISNSDVPILNFPYLS